MDTSDGLGLGGLNTELELPQYMEAVAHEMDQKITATRKRVEAGKDSQVAIAKAVATRRDIASISSVVTEANDGMTSKKPRIEALIKRFDQNKAAQDIKDDKQ
jgi:cell division protein ZapA (FtsZ GTPase activity inhibitor)